MTVPQQAATSRTTESLPAKFPISLTFQCQAVTIVPSKDLAHVHLTTKVDSTGDVTVLHTGPLDAGVTIAVPVGAQTFHFVIRDANDDVLFNVKDDVAVDQCPPPVPL
jgi:hypothetical protein